MVGGSGEGPRVMSRSALFSFAPKNPPAVAAGQWWRLVTAGFLHGGLIHILMNSWSFLTLGSLAEEAFGASRMLVIYFCSTVFGFYLSYLMSPSLSIGASAAIFGLIGAMIAVSIKEPARYGHMRRTFIGWAMFGVVYLFLDLRIDNYAHFIGLVARFA